MWSVPEPLSEAALRRASRWAEENTRMMAPCLLVAEVTNAIYKRVRRAEMDLSTAQAALSVALAFPIDLVEEASLPSRALALADEHRRPNTYDCHYLALAERHRCELWTGDERFYNSVRERLPWVKWIGKVDGESPAEQTR